MPRLISILLLSLVSFSLFAEAEAPSPAPQITSQRIEKIPTGADDAQTKNLLNQMAKTAGWFPEIKINVSHGIVSIEGKVKNQKQLDWLAKTADKLPTVIAVINKAELITPPFTDMSPFFNELKKIANMVKKNLPRIALGFMMGSLLVFLGFKIQGFSKRLWSRRVSNIFLASTIARIFMIPVWLMFFYLCLLTIGMQSLAGTIIGGTGVLGIVLGFAFKGIAENYLSGILLAIRSPFTKGDAVRINDVEGIVQNLNMRGTTILDADANLILVPNIMVIQSVVKNLTANEKKRATITFGVGMCDSVKQCLDLTLESLKSIPGICMEPAPLIFAENFGTSTVNIRVYFWFNRVASNEAVLKSTALVKTKELLMANGMHFPDSARELIFVDPVKVEMLEDVTSAEQVLEEKKSKAMLKARENFDEAKALDDKDSGKEHENEMKKIASEVSLPTQSANDNLLSH